MSWADSRLNDEVRVYEAHTPMPDGTERVRYAYGPPWVAMALYMDDIAFDTPEEAKRFWDNGSKHLE